MENRHFHSSLRDQGWRGWENKEAETSDGYKREAGAEAGLSFSFLLSFSLLPSPLFSFPLHPSKIFGRNQRSKESIHPPQFLGMRRSIQGLSYFISFFFLIPDSTNISLPVIGVHVGFSRSRESLRPRFLFSGLLRGSWFREQAQEGAEDRHGPGGV